VVRRREKVVRALAECLDNPFSAYLSPADVARLETRVESRVATPGVELTPRDPTLVREVRPGTTAYDDGLRAGDRVVKLGQRSTAHMTLQEMNTALTGPAGTSIKLGITKSSGESQELMAIRTHIPEPDVQTKALKNDFLYVRLSAFAPQVTNKIKGAILERKTRGVILDMRHNTGGLISEGVDLLNVRRQLCIGHRVRRDGAQRARASHHFGHPNFGQRQHSKAHQNARRWAT